MRDADNDKSLAYARESLLEDMGPLLAAELANPITTEVLKYANGALYAKRMGQGLTLFGQMDADDAHRFVLRARSITKKPMLGDANPYLECKLPWINCRMAASIPPVTSTTTFSLRKMAERVFVLDECVQSGLCSPETAALLREAHPAR